MKILMLNNEFPPIGGGTASVNASLLDALANDSSLSVELVTSSGGAPTSVTKLSDNVQIHRLKGKTQASLHHATVFDLVSFIITALPYSLRLHRKEKFNLIFAWATLPAGLVAWIIKLLTGIPYIVRVSGPDIPGWEKRYSVLTKIFSPIIKMVWRSASVTTAKCQEERDEILQNCNVLRVALLPTAVPNLKLGERKKTDNSIKFLCVARLIARKRHELLIRTLALVPPEINWSLSLVGAGDEEARLRSLVIDLSLETKVSFYGYVDRSCINAVYHEHDVFISLSENESMSVAALEAIATGLPCILAKSAAQGLSEISGIRLLDGDNKETLAGEIVQTISSLDSIRATTSQSHFLPGDMARNYKDLFTSVLLSSSDH